MSPKTVEARAGGRGGAVVSKRRPVGIALGFYISRKQRGSWWVWSLHADANKNTSECSLHDNTGVVVLKAEIHCFTT